MSPRRSAGHWLAPLALVGTLVALSVAPVATARPPGPVIENARGAVVAVMPSSIAPAARAGFAGTGFTAGEEVSVKVDEGDVLRAGGADVFLVTTAGSDGKIQGSVDLALASPTLAAGPHVLRFLSSVPAARSLHADFAVALPEGSAPIAPLTPTTPEGPAAPAVPGASIAPAVATVITPGDDGATTTLKLRSTSLKVRATHKATLKLAAGAGGSAGKVQIRSALKVKLTKHKPAKRPVLFSTTSYFIGSGRQGTVTLKLTKDGRALVAKKKSLKATVVLTDANGATLTATLAVIR